MAHIAGQRDAIGAGPGDEFLGGFGCVRGAVDGDVCSGLGQRDGNARTQTTRRPGNEGCLAFEAEFVKN
jgi:hypothetical protein